MDEQINTFPNKRNQKGFSLIESMVAMAVLSIVVTAAYYGIENITKSSTQVTTLNTLNNRVSEIVENLRSTINQQIIYFPQEVPCINANSAFSCGTSDYDTTGAYDNALDSLLDTNDDLPMGWSLQTEAPVNQCTNCPGRYGYVISQLPGQGNLYKVKIKFTHRDWGNISKNFEFLVTK